MNTDTETVTEATPDAPAASRKGRPRRSRQLRSKRGRAAHRLALREAGYDSNYGRSRMMPESYVRHPGHQRWMSL